MRPEEIVLNGIYRGGGVCYQRTVDYIFDIRGRKRVHWHSPNTMPAVGPSGRTIWTPNGTMLLTGFAKWAKERLKS